MHDQLVYLFISINYKQLQTTLKTPHSMS